MKNCKDSQHQEGGGGPLSWRVSTGRALDGLASATRQHCSYSVRGALEARFLPQNP